MKGNRGLLLLIIALIAGGLIVFYYTYFGSKSRKQPTFQETEERKSEELAKSSTETKDILAQSPPLSASQERLEEVESKAMRVEDECQKMEKDLQEFFTYLDTKDYIRELRIGEGTFNHFIKIIRALSLDPPIPAGEGLNYDMIINNIYHFYRALELKDLTLIKLILKNEADTMEINFALFYKWLMSSDECGQKEGIPPTLDTLYRYAGFLVNSIGGRAYLFRRETRLRLLLYYYGLLIIHEADKKKMNNFGVDITPFLEPLAEEIENYQFLYFRKEYAGRLINLKDYYVKKRKVS
jgi:hypothetical protein